MAAGKTTLETQCRWAFFTTTILSKCQSSFIQKQPGWKKKRCSQSSSASAAQFACSASSTSPGSSLSCLLASAFSPTIWDGWTHSPSDIMYGEIYKSRELGDAAEGSVHPHLRQPWGFVKSWLSATPSALRGHGRAHRAKCSAVTSNYTSAPGAWNILRKSGTKRSSACVYVERLQATVSVELTHCQPVQCASRGAEKKKAFDNNKHWHKSGGRVALREHITLRWRWGEWT